LVLPTAAADVRGTGDLTVGPDVHSALGEEEEEHEAGLTEPEPAGSDQWFMAQRLYPFDKPTALDTAYRNAQEQATAAALAPRTALVAAGPWQPLGPSNIGGRVVDLVVDPVRTDTVYAGAATGGVWRST